MGKYEEMLKDASAVSGDCINHNYGSCEEGDSHCIGGAHAEYVYTFPSEADPGM